jgi:hypothetical protein
LELIADILVPSDSLTLERRMCASSKVQEALFLLVESLAARAIFSCLLVIVGLVYVCAEHLVMFDDDSLALRFPVLSHSHQFDELLYMRWMDRLAPRRCIYGLAFPFFFGSLRLVSSDCRRCFLICAINFISARQSSRRKSRGEKGKRSS